MRCVLLVLCCSLSPLCVYASAKSASPAADVSGTYEMLICDSACVFDDPAGVLVKGRIVLFTDILGRDDLQQFDENRFSNHFGETINGCFTVETVRKSAIYAGIEKVGVTSWSPQGKQFAFSIYHSPDAGYQIVVDRTKKGLSGTGSSWGAGVAAPEHPTKEKVIARLTGDASIANCTFQTSEEHEFRRMLADPVRDEVFAIEKEYRAKLVADLEVSIAPRDWAMAGWLQSDESGEAQILRAREAMPNDVLVAWMASVRTRAVSVPVTIGGMSGMQVQYRGLDASALVQLQHVEPKNAVVWLMALRDAVDKSDVATTDAALERLAACEYYDDHAADLLKAQLELFQRHPLPAAFFDAVGRLYVGWKLNGEFTERVAPFYENEYPFADLGIGNVFSLRVESGSNELFAACQQPEQTASRKETCVKIAHVLASRSRRADVLESGAMLLNDMNSFSAEDVARTREQAWLIEQYRSIHPYSSGARSFVDDDIAFAKDWIESSDEVEATRRAVVRAGMTLTPASDFRLNKVLYGNLRLLDSATNTPK